MSVKSEPKLSSSPSPKVETNEHEDRLKKLAEIIKTGINPYPAKVERDRGIASVLDNFETLSAKQDIFHIVGRLRSKREHGNLTFANLEDASGHMQLAFSKKDLGADVYKNFLQFIDVADFISVSGQAFLTHKGEKSVMVKDWKL